MDLLERDRELEELNSALGQARAGRGSVVLIGGEAGIGKTRLAQAFTAAHQDDARVVWGGCDDLSTPRTLGPFRDIGRQLGGELEHVLTDGGSRGEVFDAALASLDNQAEVTIAVIEDVHWADTATLDVLKFLGRRIDRVACLIIITHRTEALSDHPMFAMFGDLPATAVHRIVLAPFSQDAVDVLAPNYQGSKEDLYAATGGNPFLVAEAVAEAGHVVPGSIRDAVQARIARISPAARELAERVAVIPGHAQRDLLERVTDVDVEALDECHQRGLLESVGDTVWYRHELVRDAVEAGLSAPRRRRLNNDLLEALIATEGDVARIVHHAREAGAGIAVARYAPIAGQQASAASSHSEALAHYRAAADHADVMEPAQRGATMTQYAFECYLMNEADEGISAANAALELWRQLDDLENQGEVLRLLSRLHWWLGHPDEAERTGLAAVGILERIPESRYLPMALSNMAQLFMLAQRAEPAETWARRAIDAARAADDHAALAHALNNLGSARLRVGDFTGYDLLRESLELSISYGLEDHAGRAYANLVWTALDYRDYATADLLLQQGLAFAIKRELTGNVNYLTAERCRLQFERSEWPAAERDARWVLERPEFAGITQMPALTTLARLQVRRGDPEASDTLDNAWRLAKPTGELQRIWPVAVGRAELAWLRGDRSGITGAVADAYSLALAVHQPWVTEELAFWMWRGGDPQPIGGAETPYTLHMQGDWKAAAAEWDRIGCPYERAIALLESDDTADLLTALEVLDALAATPAARLVRSKLRRLGAVGVPRGPRAATRENPAGLTPRQVEVLHLITQGLTNAEIAYTLYVSPKTVDHHVSAVLAKLGVTSRREAAKLAVEMIEAPD